VEPKLEPVSEPSLNGLNTVHNSLSLSLSYILILYHCLYHMSDTKPTTETKATPPPAAPLDLPTAADVAPPAAPLAQGTASTEAAPPPAAGSFFAKMEGFAKPVRQGLRSRCV
jgi:hypothetical protein